MKTILKKLVLSCAFALLASNSSFASHLAGGEITYKYIGDSTGIPHQYEITLKLLRFTQGATLGSTASIDITSSCYPSRSETLQRDYFGSPFPNGSMNCTGVMSTAPGFELYRYKGVVTLSGTCGDFKFSYSLCCRPLFGSNLQSPASYDVYFYALLNNVNGSNSSPIFSENFTNLYSMGRASHGRHYNLNSENDSLYFKFTNTLANDTTAIPYATGYNANNPITSKAGITYDHQTGNFDFTPTTVENCQVSVVIKEFRKNAQNNQYSLVGKTVRDLIYIITSTGDTSTTDWNFHKDNQNFHKSLKPDCKDTVLEFTIGYLVPTLANDGSDFLVLDSLDNVIQVDSARSPKIYMNNGSGTVQLYLRKPLHYDDLYRIISQKGSDGNTLLNSCGYYLKENDTAFFRVSDCGTKLELIESGSSTPNIYPSPAQDHIKVSLPFNQKFSGETVSIYNLQGQILYNSVIKGDSNPKIDLHEFPNGIYTLTIRDNQNQISTSKFVIRK